MSAAAVHPPAGAPMRKLYRHALESIFAFASLADLHSVTTVCRDWSAAVNKMPPIHAMSSMGDTFFSHRCNPIRAARPLQPSDFPALRSRLGRHVSSLGASCFLESVDCLEAVSQHMPWMRTVFIRLGMPSDPEPQLLISALGRFRSLTSLELAFGRVSWEASAFNSLIAVIGGLSMLEIVTLYLPPDVFPLLSFAPLIALQSLHTLLLRSAGDDFPSCSDSQIAELRSLRSLKILEVQSVEEELFVCLLQPGHAFQWTQLPRGMGVTERLGPLLGSLSSLTELDVFMVCSDVSFLSQLRELTDVGLELGSADEPVDPDELVHALSQCSQIHRLNLVDSRLSGDHLAKLLPCFPELTSLSLAHSSAVESLRCFDTPALAKSLTELSLNVLRRCPASQIVHLLNLHSLRSISVKGLASLVGADLKAQFAAPSQRFPFLHPQVDSVRIE